MSSESPDDAGLPRRSSGGAQTLAVVATGALLILALFAFSVSLAVLGLSCVNTDHTELDDCRHDARTQFVLAAAGLVSAVALVVAAFLDRRRLAVLALAVGVAIYAGWGILLNSMVN